MRSRAGEGRGSRRNRIGICWLLGAIASRSQRTSVSEARRLRDIERHASATSRRWHAAITSRVLPPDLPSIMGQVDDVPSIMGHDGRSCAQGWNCCNCFSNAVLSPHKEGIAGNRSTYAVLTPHTEGIASLTPEETTLAAP